ncbi:hypothetical protein [Paraburkholderia sacchari]|uniref:Uncharacterized protein n=1 Tax=Paraburkholderia sacchari TaxID=159450 RepID=A0A8T6ZIB8_9BURK|nr:hypothetical protein [Paraburkholderia sacchari]NLP64352.1 hypothetical protein [Paraburkholderia sacchari]
MNVQHLDPARVRAVRTLRDAREVVPSALAPRLLKAVEHTRGEHQALPGLRFAVDRRAGVLLASYCGGPWQAIE